MVARLQTTNLFKLLHGGKKMPQEFLANMELEILGKIEQFLKRQEMVPMFFTFSS